MAVDGDATGEGDEAAESPRLRTLRRRLHAFARGPNGVRSDLVLTREVYMRMLALCLLIAFASMLVQLPGLVGEDGILPASDRLASIQGSFDRQGRGADAIWNFPTALWFGATDTHLLGFAWAGVAASVLLMLGFAPPLMLLVAWWLYLSLCVGGGLFFSYQWDALLLEVTFFSLLVVPWRIHPRGPPQIPVSTWGFVALRVVLFKLMFLSGWVKLASGDTTWRNLSALDYHFFTQPLPSWISFHAHHFNDDISRWSVVVMFIIELGAPFFFFSRRTGRVAAGISVIALMAGIGVTGNYGFFNLLTVTLAITLLDDEALNALAPGGFFRRFADYRRSAIDPSDLRERIELVARPALAVGAISLVLLSMADAMDRERRLPGFLVRPVEVVAPFRTVNSYGLFARMTTTRPEIVVEGSLDGRNWRPYRFAYKPTELSRRPPIVFGHMPRLDWQMWFAALRQDCRNARWYPLFVKGLLENRPAVIELLDEVPFGGEAPRYVRSTLYDYTFAPPKAPERDGVWWERTDPQQYCPVLKLDDTGELEAVFLGDRGQPHD